MSEIKQTQTNWFLPNLSDSAASLKQRFTSTSPLIKLRDGEVVLFVRKGSNAWHCRYKLKEIGWVRRSTRTRSLEVAQQQACDWYDEARYRIKIGFAPDLKRFAEIAAATLTDLRNEIAAGRGKRVYVDYCSVIERYFIPYFKLKYLTTITYANVNEFEQWRNQKLGRIPAASTLLTFSAAWTRIQTTAIKRGWLSQHTPVPNLSVQGGVRAQSRPAFSAEEITRLRDYMTVWSTAGGRGKAGEMRMLLRDYVELLIFTGMRHGTEAMNVRWRHCEWYFDTAHNKYLRIWVSGKTGERYLIAKHDAVGVFERLAQRDAVCTDMTLTEVFDAKQEQLVFRFSTGEQPYHFNAVFTRLLTAAGLLRNNVGETRTLYSLRHTYATQELRMGTDIHTLAKQMGTSVLMLERFYSKLNATMSAAKLA